MFTKWKKWTSLALAVALSISAPSYAHADDLSAISSSPTDANMNASENTEGATEVSSDTVSAASPALAEEKRTPSDASVDDAAAFSQSTQSVAKEEETDVSASSVSSSDHSSSESVVADSSNSEEGKEKEIKDKKDNVDLSGLDFTSMRLVIGTDDASLIADDKSIVGSYDNVYLAQYDSEENAEKAYEKYFGKADFVEPDTGLGAAEESAENTSNTMTEAPMTENSNPMQELSAADDSSDAAADSADVVALIDTGSSSYTSGSVSMLGDDGVDRNGHGTEMARLITEEAGDASILSIKALNDAGDGTVSSVYAAMEYAISQNVKAINLSLSGYAMNDSAAIDQSIHDAVSAGILVVGSAGNNSRDASLFVPGRCTDAYIIGSCDKNGKRLSSSNYGDTVDDFVTSGSTSEAAAKFTGKLVKAGFVVDDAVKAGGVFTGDEKSLSAAEEKTEEKADKNTKIQIADTPTHTHIWETRYDATYHWQQCTVCGAIQNKETHEGHGLSNNGGVKTQSNNYNGRAYKESCTCGYESKLYMIILGSYACYNGNLSFRYDYAENINNIQQVSQSQYNEIAKSLPNVGAGYEWVDTDHDGYGWIFCKVAMPKTHCSKGTIESILGSEGDCGRKECWDEYYMLVRFLTGSTDTSLSALLNWLPSKDKIPANHCYYGYHEKYAKITETQWNELKKYFTGLSVEGSSVGWPGMKILCPLQSQSGRQYIQLSDCYDSATNQTGMSFTNGKAFTCDVCGNSATGWERYQHDWYLCWSYHGVPKGKTITCGGHYLSSPNGNRAYAYDIITKQNNDNEDVTSLVHVKCFGDNYISYCTTSYKTIATNQDGKPTEIETTVPSATHKADSTTIGADGNIYPVFANITGPVTINGTTKTITTSWGLGYTSLRIDEDAPVPYQYSDDQTANNYWQVTGSGTINKQSAQASVKVSFYDKKRYSKNIVYACCYDSDKKTVIPQGNGQTWVPMDAGNNDVWTVTLNLLVETNTSKDIYIQAKDATGNVSDLIPMKVSFLDSKPPTVSASWDSAGWTKSKKLTITASDLSGQTFVGLSADDMPDIQKAPYNGKMIYTYTNDVYTPQTLTIYAQDSAGNLGQTTAILEKIDNTAPTITSIKQTGVGYHKALITVEANDVNSNLKQSGSGVCNYGIAAASSADNITWVSGTSSAVLTVATIGNYVVYAQDNVGNISAAKPFTVSSIKYGVTFNANGGSGTMARQDIINNTGTALTKNTLAKTGYTFSGWNTATNGSGTSYKDGQTVIINSDITLYANWAPNTYTVVFNANEGTGTMANESMTYDTASVLTANAFTCTGYTFSGWNTKADGSGTSYADKVSVKNLAESGTVTLYAQWKAHTGTVTYNANGGRIGTTSKSGWSVSKDGTILLDGKIYRALNGQVDDGILVYGSKYDLANVDNQTWLNLSRTGYHVKPGAQWNTRADGTGTSFEQDTEYTAQQFIPALETTNNATATVYANWEPNVYDIVFDANTGTGTMPNESMTYDMAKALTTNAYTKKGYTFAGWNTKADGSGTKYADKESVKNLAESDTVTLYAQWAANTYTVTIPTAINYANMPTGKVDVNTSFNISVECKTGSFADTIEVSSAATQMIPKGGGNSLTATSKSSQTPLTFTSAGTKQDQVAITGTANTADVWTGAVQYTVTKK